MFVFICIIVGILLPLFVIRFKVVRPIFVVIDNANRQLTYLTDYMKLRLIRGEERHINEYYLCEEQYKIMNNAKTQINALETQFSKKIMTFHEKKTYGKFFTELKQTEDNMNSALINMNKLEALKKTLNP